MYVVFYLENKGIVLKRDGLYGLILTRARPLFKWNARVISCKNNGHARVLLGRTNQTRLKTIPLFSFLNIFDLNMQNMTKMVYNN